jgi:DNA-binding transcriptional LysR family regulator
MTDRLESIAIFVAVAELGSFAEAARRMNRAPAAVTRAVAALEDRLQVRLLNRTTRSVALTDEGARYLDGCRRLLTANDELRALEEGDHAAPRGQISVTAPAMFGRLHILPSISRFLARFPQVEVRALFLDRVVSLVDEGLDVGVRLGQLPDSSLRAIRVGELHRGIFASPDYLEQHGTPTHPRDLADHAVISCLAVTPLPDRWSFDGAGGVGQVAVHPRLIVNTTEAAADAAADGLGLTLLVCYQADAHRAAGRLVRVLADFETPGIPIQIVQPSGRFLTPKVRLFIDHLAGDLRRRYG